MTKVEMPEEARRRVEAGGETFEDELTPGERAAATLREIWRRWDASGRTSGGPFTRDEANGHE